MVLWKTQAGILWLEEFLHYAHTRPGTHASKPALTSWLWLCVLSSPNTHTHTHTHTHTTATTTLIVQVAQLSRRVEEEGEVTEALRSQLLDYRQLVTMVGCHGLLLCIASAASQEQHQLLAGK